DRRSVVLQDIQDAKLKRIKAEPEGQLVVDLFLRNRHLWHTKPTKGAGWNNIRVDGSRCGPVGGDNVRSPGVDRAARGNGWSPGRVSTGVKVSFHVERHKLAVIHCARTQIHSGRMALRSRHDGFRAGVNHPDGLSQMPRRDGNERLNGEVQLRAKA